VYNDAGLLTTYTASANGAPLWSLAMSYDLIGRLTNKVETIGGVTNTSGYIYDIAGRLGQVWQNGALGVTYTYDTNGNRLTRNAETANYDSQDRVQSYAGTTFAWSPNGTLQTSAAGGQTTNYTYDVRGALTAVALPGGTQIGYVTDGQGRRIGKQVNGALQRGWLWSWGLVAAEVDGNSVMTKQFVYAADGVTPSYIVAGTNTYRIFSDERGSVRLVVNAADGSIAQQLDYDEFGRVTTDSNPGFQPIGFAGGLYDPDTGLVRFGARDYSAETGQWTARDPILFGGGQTSLYAYSFNDPINQTDFLGTGPNHNTTDENTRINNYLNGMYGRPVAWLVRVLAVQPYLHPKAALELGGAEGGKIVALEQGMGALVVRGYIAEATSALVFTGVKVLGVATVAPTAIASEWYADAQVQVAPDLQPLSANERAPVPHVNIDAYWNKTAGTITMGNLDTSY
jgi:RHS repeat-associated protein